MALSPYDNFIVNTYGPTGLNILPHYYPCNEISGTSCTDAIGSLNGVIGVGIGLNHATILPTSDGEGMYNGAGGASVFTTFSGAWLTAYPISLEIWAKITSFVTGFPGLFSLGSGITGISFYADQQPELQNNNGGGQVVGTANLSTATAYHLVCTSDGTLTGTFFYVNGVLQSATHAGSGLASLAGLTASLLGGEFGSTSSLDATYGKAATYTAALTQAQVTANFNAGNSGVNDVLMAQGAQVAVTAGSALFQVNTPLFAQGAQIVVTPGNAQMNVNTPLLAAGAQIAVSAGSANMVVNTPLLAQGAQIAVTPGGAMFTIGGGVLDTGGVDIIGDSEAIAYGILGGQD